MGLFDLIFKPKNQKAAQQAQATFEQLTAYRPAFSTWQGSIYESELVRAAIDARARNISKLKPEIIGAAQPKLQARLRLRPNAWQTWSQFLYRCSTILDLQNTLVIVPVYNETMEVTGYAPILPSRCEVVEYQGEPWLRCQFHNGNSAATPYKECAVLTRFQYDSDFFGSDNGPLIQHTMQLVTLQEQAIAEAVKNGATFRFIAQASNFAFSEDLAKEKKRFVEENLKSEDGGGLLLFPNTYANIQQVRDQSYTIDPAQMEMINQNVFRYFSTNEDILTAKAYGDAWAAFYEQSIEPFAIQFSEAMTAAIFSDRERAQGSEIMLTANRLQYLTTSEKLNVSSQMADRGIMSLNEVREIWNLSPVEGGDRRTIRGEYYLINKDGSLTKKDDLKEMEKQDDTDE